MSTGPEAAVRPAPPDPGRAHRVPVRQSLSRRLRRASRTLIPFLIVLVAWQLSAPYIPSYIFPSPSHAVETMIRLLSETRTYDAIIVTVQRFLGGFILSAFVGIMLGIVAAVLPGGDRLFLPVIKGVMGIPGISWVLFALIWFRSIEYRVWFIMFIIVFPITAINTYDGIRSIPTDLSQMVKSFRPSTYHLLKLLVIPAAMPFIFSGMRISLSFAARIAVFAEALSAVTGIGAAMFLANQFFRTDEIIVWTIILMAVLAVLDAVLSMLERRWFRWRSLT